LISGSEQVGDEHRRENRNYLVGANRTFDLAGSLAPIGAPSIMPVTARFSGLTLHLEIIINPK
jgi:hypothetical protein